ncbi:MULTISPECIES: hypothetical protein [unclassified Rhizobacter]|uniref:hypothetical protein n=1 Tax=unclassified Rhizobacter TaxID=2640088 RepID=UPI0006F6ACB1|nr:MULTISPECIES: hypothetical protein [unclassified Rhizobacter]KQU73436.1 hypothetical protein ASC88_04275 [Rhizobacter sp. Root29]KQV98621.1 hypothetical protein ASC98_08105 [Rhizobacter sp. Root1238]KRB04874.1 hypothetical protein ASE08_13260 [Rhizobacter sp. Root16D2]
MKARFKWLLLLQACGPLLAAAHDADELHVAFGDYSVSRREVIATGRPDGESIVVVESLARTRVDGGSGPFHVASGRCISLRGAGVVSRRTCVLVDPTGDRFVFETQADEAELEGYGVRRSRLVGGSGKYAGLVGEVLAYPVSVRAGARSSGRLEIRYRSAGTAMGGVS